MCCQTSQQNGWNCKTHDHLIYQAFGQYISTDQKVFKAQEQE
jgi:hypothetical protein